MSVPQDSASHASPIKTAVVYPPVSVWTYANVLLQQWRLVFGLPVAAGVIAAVLLLLSPREYTAFVTFVPQDPIPLQAGLGQLASQLGLVGPRVSTGSPQFYADLLRSREVLRDAVTTPYEALGGSNLLQYFGIRADATNRSILDAMRQLEGIYAVRTDRLTGVVHLNVHTKDQALSAALANRFIELLNDYNLKRRQSQARAERTFIEERLAQAEEQLSIAEDNLASFYGHNRRFQDSPELLAREARLQRQVTLRQQVYVTLSQNYEAARIDEVRNTPVITVLESPDGLVARRPRGTAVKVFVVVFLVFVVSAFVVYARDYLTRARGAAPGDYDEFVRLRAGVAADVRRLIRRPTMRSGGS